MTTKKNILREKNYGIPIDVKFQGVSRSHGNRAGCTNLYEYTYHYEFVETGQHHNLKLGAGDIVRISSKFCYPPKYAKGQFAVIVDRYVLVKNKYRTFRDHVFVLMMISGPKKGHAFKLPGCKTGCLSRTLL